MEFSDLKAIWDASQQERLFAIDREALHRRVIRRHEGLTRKVTVFEWTLFLTLFLLALTMVLEGVFDNELYQLPEAALLFVAAGFIYQDRRRRVHRTGGSDRTLLGDLEMALRTIDYHARRPALVRLWFVAPMAIAMIMHMAYTIDGKPWWLWPLAGASLVVSYRLIEKEIRCQILPAREELVALRNLLLTEEGPGDHR